MKLFENKVGRPTNEIKKKRRIFVAAIVTIVLIVLVLGGYALKNVGLSNLEGAADKKYAKSTQQKAVLAVAKAYLNQGKQIQYDSYRKNLNCTPEDSTSKHTCYTVCSGLVYMTYKQALGMELPDSVDDLLAKKSAKIFSEAGKKTTVKPKVIYPKDGASSYGEFKGFINSDKHLSLVKPGDILVWEGHTMLIEKVDSKNHAIHVIHATGVNPKDNSQDDGDSGRYDTENQKELIETSGAIHRKVITANNIKKTNKIAIIRYINNKNYITPAAKTRLKRENIKITKIITGIRDQSYTTEGSELTYRIRIRNESENLYENITVQENINTKLVELKGVNLNTKYLNKKSANKIIWKIPKIASGEYVTLEYTVKVKSNIYKKDKKTIIISTGKVGNIATSRIETLVGKRLNKNQTNKLTKCIADYKTCFKEYKTTENIDIINLTSGKKFVDTLYKASLDINVGLSSIKTLGNSIMFNREDSIFKLNDSIKKYLYSNFYGLRIEDYKPNESGTNKFFKEYRYTARAHAAWGDKVDLELEERARTINSSMLREGDIVITFTDLECEKKTSEKKCCYKVSNKTNCEDDKPKDRSEKVYIYLNETYNTAGVKKFDKGLHRYIKDKTTDTASFETIKAGNDLEEFLGDLVGDNYIILRPYK